MTRPTYCPLCNTETSRFVLPATSDGTWRMYVCPRCETKFQVPNKQTAAFYDTAYFAGQGADKLVKYSVPDIVENEQAKSLVNSLSRRLRIQHRPRFLDIGPGNGAVLIEAQKTFRCSAYDVTSANKQLLYDRGYIGTFEEVNLESERFTATTRFDVVHLSEVVEHLSRPQLFFKNVSSLLDDNGILFIQTGRADSLIAGILGSRWSYYRIVHSIIYSRRSLEALLAANKFRTISVSRDAESIGEALRIFLRSRRCVYLLAYLLGRLVPSYGRMQVVSVKAA